ncbi:MAG: P-II family nitrogen regulator [Armatimonadetes bacterium]|jgi:nitrogen regulatory protein PII|nr:P-II family nitrogen regulator [Armatimonadota bacterium]
MVRVEAIIRHTRLEEVKNSLDALGIQGMTVTAVRGAGRQRGQTHRYRGSEYTLTLVDKVKVEAVVPDELADGVAEAVQRAAFTGEIGDGKIFLLPVMDAIRVRTGERGNGALS